MPSVWPKPLPFIETFDDQLVINSQTAQLLNEITRPIIPVAIAGVYRTGKSYLMNRLARVKNGFPLGNTVQSKTKGIWIWCCEHPLYPDKALLLLDTEGLSDPEKDDEHHDMTIFSISILLCTVFIFNAIGKIDQDMINKLHFVTELTESIKVRSRILSNDDDEGSTYNEFAKYFPCFVLAVRDFMLTLEINGVVVSANEYFDHILQLQKGSSKKISNHNLQREAIRKAFRSHHCFVFPRPVQQEEQFQKLEELQEHELSPVFLAQSKFFCDFVFQNSNEKTLNGKMMNGRLFLCLADHYAKAINSGAVPCIESTVALVTEKENRRLHEESVNFYQEQMTLLNLPETKEGVAEAHKVAYDVAMEYFRGSVVFDEKGDFANSLMKRIETMYGEILTKNEDASTEFCNAILSNLYKSIIGKKMKKQEYTCPGGYEKFETDMKQLKQEYHSKKRKGVMAEVVYNDFMKGKQSERFTILSADTLLSEKEKELEAAKKAKESAETEARLKQESIVEENRRIAAMNQEHQEQLEKLKKENEEQINNRTKELQETLQAKLAEQEKLMQQGFTEKAEEMQEEIHRLTEESKPGSVWQHVDRVTNIVNAVGMLGMGVSGLKSMGSGIKGVGGRVVGFFRRAV